MTSIGETLRRERVRRNLAIDQISRELKISPKMLEAIESEHFEKLPGAIFAKNFVRQYAHMLGLDEDEMVAEVQRALQPSVEAPRFAETGRQPAAPIQVAPIPLPRVEEWESASERSFSWSSPLPALALFVVAMLVCSGVYAWYQKTQTRRAVPAQTSAAATSTPAVQTAPPVAQPQTQPASPQLPSPATQPAAGNAPPAQTAAQQSTPATPQSAPQSTTEQKPQQQIAAKPAPASSGPAGVRVQITAEEPSWVLVRCDGKYLFSGTMEANQTRTVEAASNMELRLGNAGGVSVVLNGKLLGALGPKGQVRTVQFTSGGFQIVAAPKSAPLIDPL